MKKKFLILIAAIPVLFALLAAKFFLVGDPADPGTLYAHVEDTGNQLTILISSAESAAAFTDVQYRQQGSTMDISFRRVLVSPIHSSGEKCIYLEKGGLSEVYVCGELVWSAS